MRVCRANSVSYLESLLAAACLLFLELQFAIQCDLENVAVCVVFGSEWETCC